MSGFLNLNLDDTFRGIDPTPEGAKQYLKGTIDNALKLYDRSIERWMLCAQEMQMSDAIIGKGRFPQNRLASNLRLRQRVSYRLIDRIHRMEIEMPGRRCFLATLISDRWLSFDRDTTIWLRGMKDAIRQVMRLGGFDGWFGLLELQTLDETVRPFGRILLPHGHFLVWSDDPSFSPEDAQARMCASGRLQSLTSARTVDIRVDPQTSVCNILAYILKAADCAKYRVLVPNSPSGIGLADCRLPPVSAVRQAEVLSLIEFGELALSGGNGTFLREELTSEIDRLLEGQTREVDTDQASRFWARARRHTKNDSYRPVLIDRSGAQLSRVSSMGLACAQRPDTQWNMAWLIENHAPPGFWTKEIKRLTALMTWETSRRSI